MSQWVGAIPVDLRQDSGFTPYYFPADKTCLWPLIVNCEKLHSLYCTKLTHTCLYLLLQFDSNFMSNHRCCWNDDAARQYLLIRWNIFRFEKCHWWNWTTGNHSLAAYQQIFPQIWRRWQRRKGSSSWNHLNGGCVLIGYLHFCHEHMQ